MIKERGILGSIAVLLAAVAFSFFYSAHKDAARGEPRTGQWTSGFQVEPLTHPPWWWR
jgi:hypothetical protein